MVLAPRFGMEMKRVREGFDNTSYMRLKRGAVRTFSDVACPACACGVPAHAGCAVAEGYRFVVCKRFRVRRGVYIRVNCLTWILNYPFRRRAGND